MWWLKGIIRLLAMGALTYIAIAQMYDWGVPGEFQEAETVRAVASIPRSTESVAVRSTVSGSTKFSFGECPEGGGESVIIETHGLYSLVRDHCSDLENSEFLDQRKLEARGEKLIFNGETFSRE
jgi:hypothetical protein